jgi:hypothetical protein
MVLVQPAMVSGDWRARGSHRAVKASGTTGRQGLFNVGPRTEPASREKGERPCAPEK